MGLARKSDLTKAARKLTILPTKDVKVTSSASGQLITRVPDFTEAYNPDPRLPLIAPNLEKLLGEWYQCEDSLFVEAMNLPFGDELSEDSPVVAIPQTKFGYCGVWP